jgi:uncharacterized lipoprotein
MNRSNDNGTLIVKRNLSIAFVMIAAVSLLSGCGYLRTKFGNKQDAYKNSSQERPLEVPPDLERPNTSGALVIPERGNAPAPSSGDLSSRPADGVPAIAPGVTSGGDGLIVADTVGNTWSRVGLALERSGKATIQSRDESAHTYEIRASGQTTKPPGWFKRTITFGKAGGKQVSSPVPLNIRVSEEGAGSKVSVEGTSDEAGQSAARAVLDALRERLS